MTTINDDVLKKYFYDVNSGYVSADKLYTKMIEAGYDIKRADVHKFHKSQEVNQKTSRKPKRLDHVYNSIIASEYGANYQIDIIIYDRFEFHKYKYILHGLMVSSSIAV